MGPEGGLGRLLERAGRLRRLHGRFSEALPEELRPHCQVVNVRGDTLVVSCDSAAWGARLRYLERQLLGQLGVAGLRRLRVKVRPPEHPAVAARPAGHSPRLDKAGAALIESAARGVDDAGLAEALRRLARRGRS